MRGRRRRCSVDIVLVRQGSLQSFLLGAGGMRNLAIDDADQGGVGFRSAMDVPGHVIYSAFSTTSPFLMMTFELVSPAARTDRPSRGFPSTDRTSAHEPSAIRPSSAA